jgi:hypothetical protein
MSRPRLPAASVAALPRISSRTLPSPPSQHPRLHPHETPQVPRFRHNPKANRRHPAGRGPAAPTLVSPFREVVALAFDVERVCRRGARGRLLRPLWRCRNRRSGWSPPGRRGPAPGARSAGKVSERAHRGPGVAISRGAGRGSRSSWRSSRRGGSQSPPRPESESPRRFGIPRSRPPPV